MWITIGQQCQKHHDTNGKSNRRKAIADAAGVPWWKQRDLLLSKGGSNDDRKMKNGARTMGGERVVRQSWSRAAKKMKWKPKAES